MTVVAFESARHLREMKWFAARDMDFEIDWSDIVCYHDSFEKSAGDPIRLGAKVLRQVRTIFDAFGLPQTPATWGELCNNYVYCQQLAYLVNLEELTVEPRHAIRAAELFAPGYGTKVKALLEGNIRELERIHQQENIFYTNAKREI